MTEAATSHGRHPEGRAPLSTSRPWLAIAGCLGGSAFAVAVALLVLAAVVLMVFFPNLLSPGRREQAMLVRALGRLREAPALRVATREIAVRVEGSLPREVTVRPWLLPLGPGKEVEIGRTSVEILAPGNVVQYVVPLVDGPDDRIGRPMRFIEDGDDAWIVVLPPPVVDESLVEVQSDPARLEIEIDRDWIDHVVREDRVRDEALAAIRAAVVREASSEVAMFEVREKARSTVADVIRALLPEDMRSHAIRVRWSDEESERK